MTPQEHNKYVGLAQLGYAGFQVLMMILGIAFTGLVFVDMGSSIDEPPFFALFCLILVVGGVIQIVMTIPSWIAGYALLKCRRWAKVAGIAASVGAYLSFPVGSVVAAYTFLFLFSEAGKQVYPGKSRYLPPLPPKEWPAANGTDFA
jgi:hypothetical protein